MTRKSNEKSNSLRQTGNALYKKKNFFDALLKYNESLCYSQSKSESAGLAYANRSAVYFELKLYEICLENIKLAIESNYPKESVEVLENRREKCLGLMKKIRMSKNGENFFKISPPVNKKIPYIADCLELKFDSKYGRYVVTNCPLKVGQIIAIEKPFSSVIISQSQFVEVPEMNIYQRCNRCLKDKQLNLFPCESCCEAMFCSTECYNYAIKSFHQFECPVMEQLLKSASVNMALRIFFIGLSIFDNSIEKLKAFFNETIRNPVTIFKCDMSSEKTIEYERNYFKSLLSLSKSSKIFLMSQYEDILSVHPTLSETFSSHRKFITNFLQHVCQISDHNFHAIFSGSLKSSDEINAKALQQSIGTCSLPFISLINHSCTPNIMRICNDANVVAVVCRPIKKGSQIFDCYKVNFMMCPKEIRQRRLLEEFGFICDCEACEKNWPTARLMKIQDEKLLKIAKKINDEVSSCLCEAKRIRECSDILQQNDEKYPSMELCMMQRSLAALILKLARPQISFL